jgi:HTH-type transcriptional regulator/antitoxin HigA
METRPYIPFEASHPGSLIKDELKFRGISQKDFARDIDIQPTMLNELINEKRAVTAEIALLLEHGLKIPAEYWMRYQANYELDCARIKERNILKAQQIEIWGLIKQYVPVSIFSKLGLFTNSLADNISKIWEIYGVHNTDELNESVSANKKQSFYKKSEKLINDQLNIFAWSKLAQWRAQSEIVGAFAPESKEAMLSELKDLFCHNVQVVTETKRILNSYGIKFLVIEKFKQSPVDGYSFWSLDNPAIVVTQRKKQLDNFAFTVMHELGHLFEHLLPNHEESFLDMEFAASGHNGKEEQAHSFARKCFIEDATWADFLARNTPFDFRTTEKQMVQLADNLKIHPSIVLGRYCFESGQFALKTGIDRTIN